jgi:hypothetical protein
MPTELERAQAFQEQERKRCAWREAQKNALRGDEQARHDLELHWLPFLQPPLIDICPDEETERGNW